MQEIAQALADLDSVQLKKEIQTAIAKGTDPQTIVRDGLGEGMKLVGERYERGEYFLAELIMAGVTMNEAMELIRPALSRRQMKPAGKVVIGTVEGDLHDIGKNIVISMLSAAGLEVIDIGVDVSPTMFVESVKKEKPDLLCLSTLLSVTMPNVEATIQALTKAGLRSKVRVLVGGRCLNAGIAKTIGADAFGVDAWDAVVKAKALLSS